MKTPSAPSASETAAAQGGMNRDTAITQQQLNMTNQINPWGTVGYEQTGTEGFTDSQGNWIETPSYTQTTTLSPEQQAIFDQTQAAEGNLAGLANEQSAFLSDYLNEPFQFDNSDAEQWAYDLASPRLLQQQGQNESSLRSMLANKGIREGSAAWNAEMQRMTQGNSDQLNQLALTGRGQAFGEQMATRNAPINEITALLSGSQVANPAQMSGPTPQTGVAGVDYTGLVNQQYQGQVANQQNKLGGLFGLGSAGITAFSDRRLKRDVERTGTTPNGLPWYSFNYVWDADGSPVRQGLMSDDVRLKAPDAVEVDESGFDKVNYSIAMEA